MNTFDNGVRWGVFKGTGKNGPEYTVLCDGQKVQIRILINPGTDRERERLIDMSVDDLRSLGVVASDLLKGLR